MMVTAKKQVAKKSVVAKVVEKIAAKTRGKGGKADKAKPRHVSAQDKINAQIAAEIKANPNRVIGTVVAPKKKALIPLREGRAIPDGGEGERCRVPVRSIRLTETQTRESVNAEKVNEYAALMRDGVEFPDVLLCRDQDGALHCAGGMHRTLAAIEAELEMINARVLPGNKWNAILIGSGDNAKHGLNMSRADKQRAVRMHLEAAKELGLNPSSRDVARHCGVDHKTVESLRRAMAEESVTAAMAEEGFGETPQSAEPEKRTGKDGVARTVAAKGNRMPNMPAPLYKVNEAVQVQTGGQKREWGKVVEVYPAERSGDKHCYSVQLTTGVLRGKSPLNYSQDELLAKCQVVAPKTKYSVGDDVRVCSGMNHGRTGKVLEISNTKRGGSDPMNIYKITGLEWTWVDEPCLEPYSGKLTVAPAATAEGVGAPTMHVPGRSGKDLGQLERGGGDDGATAGAEDLPLNPRELYTPEQIHSTVRAALLSYTGSEARLEKLFEGHHPTNAELLKLAGELLGEGGGSGGAGRLDYACKGGAKPRVIVGSMLLKDSKVGLVIEGAELAAHMRQIWGAGASSAPAAEGQAEALTEDVIHEAVRNSFLMMPDAGPQIYKAMARGASDNELLSLAGLLLSEEGGTGLSNGMEASFNGDPIPVVCIFADQESAKPLLVLEGLELARRMRAAFVIAEYAGKKFDWDAFTRDAQYILKTLDVMKTYRPEKEHLAEALRITGHIGLEAGKLFDLFRDLAAQQGIVNEG